MNQILVTEKLYITPVLKRKKKLFKFEFFLSVFLVCILSSYYIYAEYNRNESEQVSQQILAEVKADSTTKKIEENDVMVIVLSEERIEEIEVEEETEQSVETPEEEEERDFNTYTTSSGTKYETDAVITIPSIGITYPVLSKTSDKLLEISVNKYSGPNPNEVGN